MTWGTIWSEAVSFGPLLYFWNWVNLQCCVNICCIIEWFSIYVCVCMYVCVYIYVCIYNSESHSVVSDSLWHYGLYSPWNSPGQNTGVVSHSFLQGIFLTQGLNPGLLHYRQILYQLSHKGSPRVLEWVAYPFSSGAFQPRNQTGFFCIAGRFFNNWAIREAQIILNVKINRFIIYICLFLSSHLYLYTLILI